MSMVGNIPFLVNSIGLGVLVAVILATLNTMLMIAREQTHGRRHSSCTWLRQ